VPVSGEISGCVSAGEFVMVASRIAIGAMGLAVAVLTAMPSVRAADPGFPFEKELLLETRPMKGSKRIPILTVGARGETTVDLWCNSVEGQTIVDANTLRFTAVATTENQCDAARMKGDDDLLAALQEITTWRLDGPVLTLSGGKTLRFRAATN
jgi:heat shock protein HslJ